MVSFVEGMADSESLDLILTHNKKEHILIYILKYSYMAMLISGRTMFSYSTSHHIRIIIVSVALVQDRYQLMLQCKLLSLKS